MAGEESQLQPHLMLYAHMRLGERDALLLVLAISAGSADGWSYCGLGHAFVANMTGNTVLLGLAVFGGHGALLHPLIALCCYVVGVAIASFLTKGVHPDAIWHKSISAMLLLEGALVGLVAAGWFAIQDHARPSGLPVSLGQDHLLLGALALAIGIQSGAILQLKVPGIVTTYITGTWTNLVNGLVRFETAAKSSVPRQRREFEARLMLQSGILAAYFLSAVLTGWLFEHSPSVVGVLPTLSALFVAFYGFART